MNEQTIFTEALDLLDPAERVAYLERACGRDAALRQRVERLLAQHDHAGSFLEAPAVPLAPTAELSQPARAGEVIGPFKLLRQIGEGGMGVVFVAEQTRPVQRQVALKVIKPGMDSRQVSARFEAERQALALMDHPNIARVLDAGTADSGRPYFVMELVAGVPITRYCDEAHISIRDRLGLFIQVCAAVQHAHTKGVIHRDLKPSNVLVTLQGGKPVPKVIDFGVAKALHGKLTDGSLFTEIGQIIGTLEYMAPEQAELGASDVDTRADVYALGVLLYELLTGGTPLRRERLKEAAFGEVLRLVREEETPKPSTRLSGSGDALAAISARRQAEPATLPKLLRGELDWIVMKTLEKDRIRRYETVDGLSLDVQRYLADEPVQACPPSAGYRLGKFARHHRAALVTTGTVAVILLVAAVVSIWQAVEATQARGLAEVRLQNETRARAKEERQRQRAEDNFGAVLDGMTEFLEELGSSDVLEDSQKVTLRQALADHMEAFFQRLAEAPRSDTLTLHQTGWAFLHLGVFYQRLGDYTRAEAQCRKALDIHEGQARRHPEDLEILWMYSRTLETLGTVVFLGGRTAEGRTILRLAFEQHRFRLGVDPSGRAHAELSKFLVTCVDKSLRDADDALRIASRGVELGPDSPSHWYQLSRAYYVTDNWLESRRCVDKYVTLEGQEDAWSFLLHAMICWRLGERDRAHTYYDQAMSRMNGRYPERHSFILRQLRDEAAVLLEKRDPALPIRAN